MGSRYGVKIRKRRDAILEKKNEKYECPVCGKKEVVRIGYARWKCKACGAEFAGGAYSFTTDIGETAKKALKFALSNTEK